MGMISKKAMNVKSFMVMDVMARAEELEKQGKNIIHLEVGEPDFDTPDVISNAAIEAIRSGKTHYTHAMGILSLREEICKNYFEKYNISLSPEQILITSGTSPAMLLMMMAILENQDEVILSNPGYACYPNFVQSLGGTVVEIKTDSSNGFQYTSEDIRKNISKKTKAILINSPSNPTGIVMTEKQMQNIAEFDRAYILSDEIYHGLVYEGKEHSILEYTNKAFVVNGFSKLYAMTGWRLGYLIFPKNFSSVMEKIHQNFMISANSFVQAAGIAALQNASFDILKMKEIYNKRRIFMIKRLKELGFKIDVEPTGAFYVFADARHFFKDSYKAAFDILESVGVGVTPGIDFGSGGEGYLRFSYANSMENIEEGLNRIESYLLAKK